MRIFVTVLCLFALIFQVKADERKKTYEKKISKCELEELTINNKHGKIEVVQHDQEALEIVALDGLICSVDNIAGCKCVWVCLAEVVHKPVVFSPFLSFLLGKA